MLSLTLMHLPWPGQPSPRPPPPLLPPAARSNSLSLSLSLSPPPPLSLSLFLAENIMQEGYSKFGISVNRILSPPPPSPILPCTHAPRHEPQPAKLSCSWACPDLKLTRPHTSRVTAGVKGRTSSSPQIAQVLCCSRFSCGLCITSRRLDIELPKKAHPSALSGPYHFGPLSVQSFLF